MARLRHRVWDSLGISKEVLDHKDRAIVSEPQVPSMEHQVKVDQALPDYLVVSHHLEMGMVHSRHMARQVAVHLDVVMVVSVLALDLVRHLIVHTVHQLQDFSNKVTMDSAVEVDLKNLQTHLTVFQVLVCKTDQMVALGEHRRRHMALQAPEVQAGEDQAAAEDLVEEEAPAAVDLAMMETIMM